MTPDYKELRHLAEENINGAVNIFAQDLVKILDELELKDSRLRISKQDIALRDKLIRKYEEEREKLVAVLKATRQLMGGLHTLGWARMDSGPEAPCCISHGEFKHLLYKLQQPVDEALKDCAGIEGGSA